MQNQAFPGHLAGFWSYLCTMPIIASKISQLGNWGIAKDASEN
jgi:hypothetical protein